MHSTISKVALQISEQSLPIPEPLSLYILTVAGSPYRRVPGRACHIRALKVDIEREQAIARATQSRSFSILPRWKSNHSRTAKRRSWHKITLLRLCEEIGKRNKRMHIEDYGMGVDLFAIVGSIGLRHLSGGWHLQSLPDLNLFFTQILDRVCYTLIKFINYSNCHAICMMQLPERVTLHY